MTRMQPGRSFWTSFSQKWIGIQSISSSKASFLRSLAMFSSIFSIQYSRLAFSRDFRVAQSYPCQNSPSTKMASRYFVITISGEPGSLLSLRRYRYPECHSALANMASALPRLRWTLDIRFLVSGVELYDLGCFIAFRRVEPNLHTPH